MIPLAEMSPACDVAVEASTLTAQDNTGSNKIGAKLIRKIHTAKTQFALDSTKLELFIPSGRDRLKILVLHTPMSVQHEQIPKYVTQMLRQWGTNLEDSSPSIHSPTL